MSFGIILRTKIEKTQLLLGLEPTTGLLVDSVEFIGNYHEKISDFEKFQIFV